MNTLISIIIPLYNSEKYLDRCITSILGQTLRSFELILIDDGSTDKSGLICDEYAKQDSRVKVKHIANSGVSNARNIGLLTAIGKYIAFIDSDDYVDGNYIYELYNSLIDNSSELALCPIRIVSGNVSQDLNVGSGIIHFNQIEKQFFLNLNNKYLMYGPTNKLYLNKVIKKNNLRFDNKISYGEDLIFNFSYYKHINKISITDSVFYYYVQANNESLSKKYHENRWWIAKRIHYTLLDFFNYIGLTDEESYGFLYGRLFDDIYNSLLQINHQKSKKGIVNVYKFIKHILEDDELDNCIKYADVSMYSKKIVNIVKLKSAVLFLIFNYIALFKYRFKEKFKYEHNW